MEASTHGMASKGAETQDIREHSGGKYDMQQARHRVSKQPCFRFDRLRIVRKKTCGIKYGIGYSEEGLWVLG